jgi:hypothetical protein
MWRKPQPRLLLPPATLLLGLGLGFLLSPKPTAGVDLRDVALAGLASIPEFDIGKITYVHIALAV